MYWQEDDQPERPAPVDDVVDVMFSLRCRSIPVDHAFALSRAILAAAPWLADEPEGAIHTIHVAGSQNGWERPEHGTDTMIHLSRRTKLGIRVPKARIDELKQALEDQTLDIAGSSLAIGPGKPRPMSTETTLFARYVVPDNGPTEGLSEDTFLDWAATELRRHGIRIRKALCGKTVALETPTGPIETRSLLLAELAPDDALLLQRHGLGAHRTMGCGIFIPHKGIEAIAKPKS
jgi:CRISPR-associated protein Cas6